MDYPFSSNMNNVVANSSYSFNENYSNAGYVLNGYYNGGLISSSNTFDLTRNWRIKFKYTFVSNLSTSWNHLISFGTHSKGSSGFDVPDYVIAITSAKSNVNHILHTIKSIDTAEHVYEIVYEAESKICYVQIDGRTVNTIEDIIFPSKQKGLYLSGGYNVSINCRLRDFTFEYFEYNQVASLTYDTKRDSQKTIQREVRFSQAWDNTTKSIIGRSPSIDIISKSTIRCTNFILDKNYLIFLNFDTYTIKDLGHLRFNWTYPQDDSYYQLYKFNKYDVYKRSLYFDGTYQVESNQIYDNYPELNDFTVEIDFIVDENLSFNDSVTKCYITSANINVKGEYYSTLVDMYLMQKYKDRSKLSLTFETNDLYINTGNILYTYGWVERGKVYKVRYVRKDDRFFIRINDELVFAETMDDKLLYEMGYSKPNRRYFGPNYIISLDTALAPKVQPLKSQIPFKGYINRYVISNVARYHEEDGLRRNDTFTMETDISFRPTEIQAQLQLKNRTRVIYREESTMEPKLGPDEDTLVYVPCKVPSWLEDVYYTPKIPRIDNYTAYNIEGQYYADFWKRGYGAIGPK